MSFKGKYTSSSKGVANKPITEAGFIQEPIGEEFYKYAKNVIGSLIKSVELKWHPGQTGMSLDDFVIDTAAYAIILTKEDYQNGKFRQEKANSFKNFFWFRIKKAFFAQLDELGSNPNNARFDERLGKYYEGTAVDFGPTDEYDDEPLRSNCTDDIFLDSEYKSNASSGDTSNKIDKKVSHKDKEEFNEDVLLYFYSSEKAAVLEENHKIKMEYVKKIREIAQKMTPEKQRLFNLKFQFDFSDEDYQLWKKINEEKTVRDGDAFTKMANKKYGISEGYARKKICKIKEEILKELQKDKDIYSPDSYRRNTAIPGMLEFLVARPANPEFEMDIDSLTDADCWDILMELNY